MSSFSRWPACPAGASAARTSVARLHGPEVVPRRRDHFGLQEQIDHRHRLHLRAGGRRPCARSASPWRSRRPSCARAGRECSTDNAASPSARSTTCRRCRPSRRRCSSPRRPARSVATRVAGPVSRTPSSFCTARASVWSSSLHCGMPTFWMFAYVASAIARLKCCGHADPSTRVGSSVVFGHHRGALRDLIADRPHVLDALDTSSGGSSTRPPPSAGRRSADRRRR